MEETNNQPTQNENQQEEKLNNEAKISPSEIETKSVIAQADSVANRMEEANRKAEELLSRQEAIAARMMLSGRGDAGGVQKTKEQEQEEQIEKQVKDALSLYK